jgi:hypothetical protein
MQVAQQRKLHAPELKRGSKEEEALRMELLQSVAE